MIEQPQYFILKSPVKTVYPNVPLHIIKYLFLYLHLLRAAVDTNFSNTNWKSSYTTLLQPPTIK